MEHFRNTESYFGSTGIDCLTLVFMTFLQTDTLVG